MLLNGMWLTIRITVISLIAGLIIGLLVVFMRRSHIWIISAIAKVYLWLIRGTPLLVQGLYIYLAVPQLIQLITGGNFKIPIFVASFITLSLNAGAYMAEIFRGGIQGVDIGQTEAARSLGMSQSHTMLKVILPQAFRLSIPSLFNQVIITLKDTSILSAVGLAEVVYQAKIYTGQTMEIFATYTVVALMYLIVVTIITAISNLVERRMSHGNND